MKYSIVSRFDEDSKEIENYLVSKIKGEFSQNEPDYIFVIGGDGTTLRAIHEYKDHFDSAKFVTINTGTLGFLTNFSRDEIDLAIDVVSNKTYHLEEHDHLVLNYNGEIMSELALNEVTIQMPIETQILDIYINNEHFETFRGTGICISTSLGSTAYNKSLGGAVIDYSISTLQLSEIASINSNKYRTLTSPIVLNSDTTVRIESNQLNKVITYDHLFKEVYNFKSIEISVLPKRVRFVNKNNELTFTNRVKKSFL